MFQKKTLLVTSLCRYLFTGLAPKEVLRTSFRARNWGTVYTNAASFVTALFSMQLRLLFTRHRSKTGRFGNAAKSGAFSKRYGFTCRVNCEIASIWIRLLFWHEICIIRFKVVDLARTAALAYTITTLIFWRKRVRVNIWKPHRFWRRFEVMKPCRFKTAFAWTLPEEFSKLLRNRPLGRSELAELYYYGPPGLPCSFWKIYRVPLFRELLTNSFSAFWSLKWFMFPGSLRYVVFVPLFPSSNQPRSLFP